MPSQCFILQLVLLFILQLVLLLFNVYVLPSWWLVFYIAACSTSTLFAPASLLHSSTPSLFSFGQVVSPHPSQKVSLKGGRTPPLILTCFCFNFSLTRCGVKELFLTAFYQICAASCPFYFVHLLQPQVFPGEFVLEDNSSRSPFGG